MSASYREVNYALRPAKSVERKMLVDVFQRLSAFDDIHNYRYIGFGSIYFSDFLLFHRTLGFTKMLSIENTRTTDEQDRIKLNRPYGFIETEFGHSSTVLSKIDFGNDRTIGWLDYDSKFSKSIIDDLSTFLSKAKSGSVYLASYNIQDIAPPPGVTVGRTPEERLEIAIGEENKIYLPSNWKTLLVGKIRAKLFAAILKNKADEILIRRNGPLEEQNKLNIYPIINILYRDNAQMATFGFVIYSNREKELCDNANFLSLPFAKSTVDDYFEITLPNLTFREIRHLDQNFRSQTEQPWLPLPQSDADKYWKLYRYFPHFVETEL